VRCPVGRATSLERSPPVIADSNSAADSATPAVEASVPEAELSAAELYQLTLYKWRYSLEAFGFDEQEVRDLMFMKWLYASRRLSL
jgi:hypothetical protein